MVGTHINNYKQLRRTLLNPIFFVPITKRVFVNWARPRAVYISRRRTQNFNQLSKYKNRIGYLCWWEFYWWNSQSVVKLTVFVQTTHNSVEYLACDADSPGSFLVFSDFLYCVVNLTTVRKCCQIVSHFKLKYRLASRGKKAMGKY